MIRLRTASALTIGAVAALALGGTALAAGNDDPSAPPVVEMLPDGTVVTPSPSSDDSAFSDDSASPSPSASSADSAPPSPSASSENSASPSPSPSSAGAISLDAAKAIAIRAAGGGRVTDAERETEHGRAVWDIEVQRGNVEHNIDVDRATGDVLRHRSEADNDSNDRGGRDDDHGRDGHGRDDHGRGSDD
jgi:hypothetical protein